AELGFRLNPTAKRLRAGGRSPYIGVVLTDADDAFQARVFSALEAELATVELRPVVTVAGDDPEREEAFLDECLANDLSGIIVVRSHPDAADIYARAAAASGIRIVSFDPAVSGGGISVVAGDELNAGRLPLSSCSTTGTEPSASSATTRRPSSPPAASRASNRPSPVAATSAGVPICAKTPMTRPARRTSSPPGSAPAALR